MTSSITALVSVLVLTCGLGNAWAASMSARPAAPPLPQQADQPRALMSTDVTFCANGAPCGAITGFEVALGLNDANGNAVAMGVQAARNEAESAGIPKIHAVYFNSTKPEYGIHDQYGDFTFSPGQKYRLQIQYSDTTEKAQLLVDGQPRMEVPLKLVGRITFTTKIGGGNNGDFVVADFENVTIGGFIPQGNGLFGNQVMPSPHWNTSDFNLFGLSIKPVGEDRLSQGINLHGEGTVQGLAPGQNWHNPPPGTTVEATAVVVEYWFNR